MSQEGTSSEGVAGAVALLRQASQAIRSQAGRQDALAEAACELAEASSLIAEAMITHSLVDHDARRGLLAEALSCTRAAGNVMRFALVRADDQARLRIGCSAPEPVSTHVGRDIAGDV